MKRLVDHPVLSFSEHLKTFLTAKAWVSFESCLGFFPNFASNDKRF